MSAPSRERFRAIDALFDAALDRDASERPAFLLEACPDDATLRDAVRELLDAHERSAGFLDTPAAEIGLDLLADAPDDAAPAGRVGPFRIVRELGHGGMGVVWLAERDGAEFEQRVALKLVRHARRGDATIRRFLEERRILARLEHEGIARLIDGGVTEQGLPYFAMELVEGEPVDAWCDGRRLGLDARLALMATACDAVQYAHEHLVIHRDLKPSNILVRGDGRLKLLDFGIAKLLDPLTAGREAAETATGMLALTPEYAAPEQVRGAAVSTATDTYALGVLLYVLLTGRRPYEVRGLSPAELERVVCEAEPPRPSSTFAAGAPGTSERARARGDTPERLARRLRGDLDTIVLKALHKDPARRYGSAAALADDLRRFADGRPVRARPDSAAYRARKFVRRNAALVTAAGIALAALIGATVFSAAQSAEARRQRDEAVLEARRQRALTEVQMVLGGDPRDAEGRVLPAVERIALAEQVLARSFAGEPWLVAEGIAALGTRLYELGEREAQRRMLARGLARARAAGLTTQLASLACQRVYSLAYDEHLDSARASLAEARTALAAPGARRAEADALCLNAEGQLLLAEGKGDSAVTVLARAVEAARASDNLRAQTLNDLAFALRGVGRTREASEHQRRIVRELEAAGYRGTDILPNAVSFLTASLSELGEIAAIDSTIGALMRAQATGAHSSGMLLFLRGNARLRMGDLDSADAWLARSLRDTTEGAGGLSAYLPPALTQLRLEQGRLAEARAHFATLPGGTFVRRVNRAWLGARIRRAEGDARGAAAMLEDSLRALAGSESRPRPALALPLVTAAEWRLERGDGRGADSLATLARTAAAVDSLALTRSGWVGRAELVRARARLAAGDRPGARAAAERASTALANGMGPASPFTRAAVALRDSLGR